MGKFEIFYVINWWNAMRLLLCHSLVRLVILLG